jgi:hypothetical protein
MAIFNNSIIRVELFPDETDPNAKFTNIRTGRTPAMYAGAQMEIQAALFKKKASQTDNAELYDISQFAGLPKLRIRTTNAAGSLLLDETVATSVEKDPSLDLTSWQDGTKQHFRFFFPESVTGIAVGNQFFVIYGPDGDVFGLSTMDVINPGTGAASSPTPGDPGYYNKIETQGLLLDKLDKQLAFDQPIVFGAINPVTGERGRITLQPIWDDQGLRLVPIPEPLS